MAKKSIAKQISTPQETYIDGYGVERPVYEPGYVTIGRKIYNGLDKFFNGPEFDTPINKGAGALEFFFDPAGAIGKVDDVAKLVDNLDNIKTTYKKAMLGIKNRRRAFWHEVDAAMKGRRVGGLNYAGDLLDNVPDNRAANRAAAQYNAATKAGDIEKQQSAKFALERALRRHPDDPYVNSGYWDEVHSYRDAAYNGAPYRPKRVTLILRPDGTPGYSDLTLGKIGLDELPW